MRNLEEIRDHDAMRIICGEVLLGGAERLFFEKLDKATWSGSGLLHSALQLR